MISNPALTDAQRREQCKAYVRKVAQAEYKRQQGFAPVEEPAPEPTPKDDGEHGESIVPATLVCGVALCLALAWVFAGRFDGESCLEAMLFMAAAVLIAAGMMKN